MRVLSTLIVVVLIASSTLVGTAMADNVLSDADTDAGGRYVNATVGVPVDVDFTLHATNNDGQNGCNAVFGTVTTSIVAPAGVSASPSSLSFTQCGVPQKVWFTLSAPGNYSISLTSPSGGNGGYNANPGKFTLRGVAAPVAEPEAIDDSAPTWSVPDDLTLPATDASGASASYTANASDDTGVTSASCTPASGSLFPLGSTTVECTAEDAAGNVGTASFTITVTDQTAPTIAPAANVTAEATSAAGADVSYTSPTWSDNVDAGGAADCTPASGSTFALGATLVTCTASDAAGNAASPESFTVHVVDTTAPVIDAASDITEEATSAAGATVTYTAPSWTDAVDGTGAADCSPPSGAFPLGDTLVTCTTTDEAGNAADPVSFTVHVVDTTPPDLDLPADVTREGDALGGSYVSFTTSASDLVDGAMTPTCDHESGALYPVGTTTVTCSATDEAGNTASGSFNVTITDTTPPTIGALANQSLGATSGSGATATWSASATDIVDGDVTVNCSSASGSSFALGTTTVTCSATDEAGNTATTSFTVTVSLQCNGPLAPIKAGHTTFRFGSTIPIKCQLYGASAGVSDAIIKLTMRKLNDAASGSAETVSTSAADTGNQMRYDPSADQYIYNLGTKAMSKGTWQITMDLGGGQTRSFNIALK